MLRMLGVVLQKLLTLALGIRGPSLRSLVGRDSPAGELGQFPCVVCSVPAAAWTYRSFLRHGAQVVEGAPVCLAHRAAATSEVGETASRSAR